MHVLFEVTETDERNLNDVVGDYVNRGYKVQFTVKRGQLYISAT